MRQILIVGFLLTLISGCTRKKDGITSTISIRAPSASNKVGAMSTLPANRKACYGISITGPGIPNVRASDCSPETGVLGGFVNPGDLIQAEVPQGSNRHINLYVFLEKVGENNPCPAMGGVFAVSQLSQIYLVGSTSNLTLSGSEQTVDITANFPGVTQNIAVTSAMPATCVATTPSNGPKGFRVSSASHLATGTGIKMFAHVGRAERATTLTGTGIKLKVK